MLPAALEYPWGIEMVSVCTGLLGEEGCVSTSVDTRLETEYLYFYIYIEMQYGLGNKYNSLNPALIFLTKLLTIIILEMCDE